MTDPTPTPAPVDLAELRRLLDAATDGPWEAVHVDDGSFYGQAATFDIARVVEDREEVIVAGGLVEHGGPHLGAAEEADAALIAALRNAAPWLLDRAAAAVVWRLLAERALDLAMYGEGAPGMTDTWQKLEADMRERAALDGSGVAE